MAETFQRRGGDPARFKNKYEVDHETGRVFLDRTPFTRGYPDDYGYIDGTLGEDGDPLDARHDPELRVPGLRGGRRAVGLYPWSTRPAETTKVLCVPADVRFDDIKDVDDVSEYHKAEIANFFEQYKALSRAKVMPGDYWIGAAKAEEEIVSTQAPR